MYWRNIPFQFTTLVEMMERKRRRHAVVQRPVAAASVLVSIKIQNQGLTQEIKI